MLNINLNVSKIFKSGCFSALVCLVSVHIPYSNLTHTIQTEALEQFIFETFRFNIYI